MSNAQRIPAFVNSRSGTAEGARDALSAAGLFDIHEVEPAKLQEEIAAAVKGGPKRILVSGGDGSIRTGAGAVAGTEVELAILPAGTLNHFAKDHGVPEDFGDAARVGASGRVENADAAYVGDEIFLNTSSIGAYVRFMRVRERLEKKLGYRLASLIASVSTFFYMRSLIVELEIEGEKRTYRTPIVFIGVGERELQMPTLGNRIEGGRRGLHVMIVGDRKKGRLLALAWEAMRRGVKSAARTPELDAFIVESCTISMHRSATTVALDGEAVHLAIPLKYRFERDILRIVRGE